MTTLSMTAGGGSVSLGPAAAASATDSVVRLGPANWEIFFRAEYSRTARAVAVIFGDADSAEDAAQEAFADAYIRWDRISKYDQPAAWVRRVAINKMHNRTRSRNRRDIAVRRLGIARAAEAPSPNRVAIQSALAGLSEQQRIAVVLHYLDDLSINEVAAVMELSPGTVNSHLNRARTTLRGLLEDK